MPILPATQIQRGPEWDNMQANTMAAQSILAGLTQIQEAQKQRAEAEQLSQLAQIAQIDDPVMRRQAAAELVQVKKGGGGVLGGIANAFNPFGTYRGMTDVQKTVGSVLGQQAMEDPISQRMKEAQVRTAEAGATSAEIDVAWKPQEKIMNREKYLKDMESAKTQEDIAQQQIRLNELKIKGAITEEEHKGYQRELDKKKDLIYMGILEETEKQTKQKTEMGELAKQIENLKINNLISEEERQNMMAPIERAMKEAQTTLVEAQTSSTKLKPAMEAGKRRAEKIQKLKDNRTDLIASLAKTYDDDAKKTIMAQIEEMTNELIKYDNEEYSAQRVVKMWNDMGDKEKALKVYQEYAAKFGW